MKKLLLLSLLLFTITFKSFAQPVQGALPTDITVSQTQWTTVQIGWKGYYQILGDCPSPNYEVVYGEHGFDFVGGYGIKTTVNFTQYANGGNPRTYALNLSNLSPGTKYDLYIRTTCPVGIIGSVWTNVFEFSTLDYPCNIPTSIVTKNISEQTVEIKWKQTHSNYYEIQYKQFPSGNYVTQYSTDTTYTINNLSPNTMYALQIRSICSTDSSDFSSLKYFTTIVTNINELYNNSQIEFLYAIDMTGRQVKSLDGIVIGFFRYKNDIIRIKIYK